MKKNKISVGLIGFGSVGQGVIDYYFQASDPLLDEIDILAIGVKDIRKERNMPISPSSRHVPILTGDPYEKIVNNPHIDIVIDAVGGNIRANKESRKYITQSLENGKHVVSCNKAVLCDHLVPLTELANRKNVNLRYEAAVCGGIPIIRTLEEYFAHDEIMKISGIINGTSNYILTQMHQGKTLEEALHEAQSKGFAEADPTNDVEGIDALQKLVLLSSLAFHTKINPDDVLREGITQISDKDIFYLQRMLSPPRNEVYAIKLIGMVQKKNDTLDLRLHPTQISSQHPLYGTDGAINAICIQGRYSGTQVLKGPGAGSRPTAFAVINDIYEIISHLKSGTFRNYSNFNQQYQIENNPVTSGYIRSISPQNIPGVFESKCGILRKHGINISYPFNFPKENAQGTESLVPDILCIEPTDERTIQKAIKDLKKSRFVKDYGEVVYIREDPS
ncbi:homoserine dehydrogenase [Candidatus Pacearchaeota archaeon]|nr:homoserine dehydrogenase [Candidatus Pacearchaeota archaeon]